MYLHVCVYMWQVLANLLCNSHSGSELQSISLICINTTVIWEKFTVGYCHVKIVSDKILSLLGHMIKSFLTQIIFKEKHFLLYSLTHA